MITRLGILGIAVVALAGCDTSADRDQEAYDKAVAKVAQADDFALKGPLDVTHVAVVEQAAGFKTLPCDSYCLRLLYNGESQSVVAARYRPDDAHVVGDWVEKSSVAARDVAKTYRLATAAYAVGTGAGRCVPGNVDQTWDFYYSPYLHGEPHLQDRNMALAEADAGNCLVASPASLDEASAILVFSGSSPPSRLTVYARKGDTFVRVYRHTISTWGYQPQLRPKPYAGFNFQKSGTDDPRAWPDVIRQEPWPEAWRLRFVTGSLGGGGPPSRRHHRRSPISAPPQFQPVSA